RNHLTLVFGRTVAKAHSHTAQPDRRDFQIPKFQLFHSFLSVSKCHSEPSEAAPQRTKSARPGFPSRVIFPKTNRVSQQPEIFRFAQHDSSVCWMCSRVSHRYSDFKEAMSMENRYFTSDLSNLSYASLTF